MKKSIFFIAALFAATFVNAQITLDIRITGETPAYNFYQPSDFFNTSGVKRRDSYNNIVISPELRSPNYYVHEQDEVYSLITPSDLSIYKSIKFHYGDAVEPLQAITYDVFAIDMIAMLFVKKSGLTIIDEDENVLLDVEEAPYAITLTKIAGVWKLFVNYRTNATEIYTLPGDGSDPVSTQTVSTPASEKEFICRKVLRDSQVLVETENHTFTTQGQEVQ